MSISIVGATASHASSITISTHQSGDMLVIYACNGLNTTAVSAPAAGGTVPTWTAIDNPTGANGCASGTFYAVATGTTETSGTWGNTSDIIQVVLRGQASSPLGGHAESGGSATGSAVAPSITMSHTDGSSVLLHFFGTAATNGSWSAAPSGYTQQAKENSGVGSGVCLDTKNSTTSDGSVTQGDGTSVSTGYRGATVEVLAPASNAGLFFAMF